MLGGPNDDHGGLEKMETEGFTVRWEKLYGVSDF